MPKYKGCVYINDRYKKMLATKWINNEGINYCFIPYCRKCRRILNHEYAIRFRQNKPRYECIQCYLKNNNSIPKEQHRKYEPYATKYKEVLQYDDYNR